MRGDILLTMQHENNSLLSYILENGEYKLVGDYTDPVRKIC